MRRFLLAVVCGALLGCLGGTTPAAVAAPNDTGLSVGLGINYRLVQGTKLEFFYVHGSGHCLEPLRSDRVVFDLTTPADSGVWRPFILFTTQVSDDRFDSCRNGTSYATWQVRVTTPSKVVRTGSLYFSASGKSASMTCLDFSLLSCIGDSARTPNNVVNLELTIGPITGGAGPGLPFGSS